MKQYVTVPQQLSLLKEESKKQQPAKRVNIVSVKLIKESTMMYKQRAIHSPEDGYTLIKQFLGDLDREAFVVVSLDTKNQPTNITLAHLGSLNSSLIHPREVMKTAILSNAASILIGHNHPSGHSEPSQEDIHVTKRLKDVGDLLGISLLDHIILGDDCFTSLKNKGYI